MLFYRIGGYFYVFFLKELDNFSLHASEETGWQYFPYISVPGYYWLTDDDNQYIFGVWEESHPNTGGTYKLHVDGALGWICTQDPSAVKLHSLPLPDMLYLSVVDFFLSFELL